MFQGIVGYLGIKAVSTPAAMLWAVSRSGERPRFLRCVGIAPSQSAPSGITLYPFGFLSPLVWFSFIGFSPSPSI